MCVCGNGVGWGQILTMFIIGDRMYMSQIIITTCTAILFYFHPSVSLVVDRL